MFTLGDSFFAVGNYVEAALWIAIGLAFGVAALVRRGIHRRRCEEAAVVFLLFGLSDIVEVQTGAWWRPWWLLIWKAACVFAMLALLARHMRTLHRSRR